MKQLKLTITLIFFALYCSAQITTRDIVIREVEKPIIFDSTYFGYNSFYLNESELKKNIGQEIYILPISKIDKNRQYSDFYYAPHVDWDNPFKVDYDSFVNQYLTILDADIIRAKEWYLKLLYRNRDTIYYIAPYQIYEFRSGITRLPFILTAFYEKSKNQFLNKTFIEKENITSKDINSGDEVIFLKGEKWECIDVTLVDLEVDLEKYDCGKFYKPVLIFKNYKENEILVNFVEYNYDGFNISYVFKNPYSNLWDIPAEIDDFYTLEEYKLSLLQKQEQDSLELQRKIKEEDRKQTILKKYGDYYGKLINNEKVVIGMTMEMCKISWGNPLIKDEIITEDGKFVVWQYNYKIFLYFENNKLKIIKQ